MPVLLHQAPDQLLVGESGLQNFLREKCWSLKRFPSKWQDKWSRMSPGFTSNCIYIYYNCIYIYTSFHASESQLVFLWGGLASRSHSRCCQGHDCGLPCSCKRDGVWLVEDHSWQHALVCKCRTGTALRFKSSNHQSGEISKTFLQVMRDI